MGFFGLLSCEIELQPVTDVAVSNNPFSISFNSDLFNLYKGLPLGFERYSVRWHDIWAIGIDNTPFLREYFWSSYLGMGYAFLFVTFVVALVLFACKAQKEEAKHPAIKSALSAVLITICVWIASIVLTSFVMAILSPPIQTFC